MRFTPEIRAAFVQLWKKGVPVKKIAEFFDTTRQTVRTWIKRVRHPGKEHFRDKPREPKESKITVEVEVSILALRNTFSWGTARIQQGLYSLPRFMRESLPYVVQGVRLSREAINNVLAKHGINGYLNGGKGWKFFRAKEPDELWQIDLKGPFSVHGVKYWFLVCIDDYSRYLLTAEQFGHCPSTAEITGAIERLGIKPKAILSDNGAQFRDMWESWCREHGIKPLFAHPYYPQDKGKVERTIRNLNQEFVHHLRRFPDWLDGKVDEYREWFNHSRFHRGINGFPAELYKCQVGNLT
jgi:transposase InsO family protein